MVDIDLSAGSEDERPPMSSLDGYSLIGIDVDPDERLLSSLVSLRLGGLEVVSIEPVLFHGRTRGFLLIVYDRDKDPRAARAKE